MTKDNRSSLSSADNSTTGDIVSIYSTHGHTQCTSKSYTRTHISASPVRVDLLLIQDSHDVIPVCDESPLPYESIELSMHRDGF